MAPAEPMESIDHYSNLGLPSGPESLHVSSEDIKNAYRAQSRLRHPDKRPDDPNATADFQLLKSSFDVLMDESKRSVYDAKIRAGIEKRKRDELYGAKRKKLASDLEERERMAERGEGYAGEEVRRSRSEKAVAAAMKKELEEFQAKRIQKAACDYRQASRQENREEQGAIVDKERVLKVSWKKEAGDYTSARLREIFEQYGKIEDVVIRSKKNRGSALIVMSSKDAVVAAACAMSGGGLLNPLIVSSLQPAAASNAFSNFSTDYGETIDPKVVNFEDYEASIMRKLQQASEKRKQTQ